jgi:molybdopterin-guanine dinucleotide biosynthesis protein
MKTPLTIGIGASHSGAGKTTIAAALLRHLTSGSKRFGAVKYTKTAFYSSIISDKAILRQEDKDTKRLLDAGAEEVLWVQSPGSGLEEVLPMAVQRLSHLDGIIIEGNSAIEFLNPDIVIFLFSGSGKNLKPSARKLSKQADITIALGNSEQPARSKVQFKAKVKTLRFSRLADAAKEQNIEELISYMATISDKKRLAGILKSKSVNGKISCGSARQVAEDLGIPYSEVGKAADELNIKIINCELGCF